MKLELALSPTITDNNFLSCFTSFLFAEVVIVRQTSISSCLWMIENYAETSSVHIKLKWATADEMFEKVYCFFEYHKQTFTAQLEITLAYKIRAKNQQLLFQSSVSILNNTQSCLLRALENCLAVEAPPMVGSIFELASGYWMKLVEKTIQQVVHFRSSWPNLN